MQFTRKFSQKCGVRFIVVMAGDNEWCVVMTMHVTNLLGLLIMSLITSNTRVSQSRFFSFFIVSESRCFSKSVSKFVSRIERILKSLGLAVKTATLAVSQSLTMTPYRENSRFHTHSLLTKLVVSNRK